MHDEYLKQCNEHINLTCAWFLFCLVLVSYILLVWFVASLCSVHVLQRETVHTVGHAIRAPSSLLPPLSLSLFDPLSVFFLVTISLFALLHGPTALSCHIFLDRFTIKANSKEESRLDAPFTRQLRGRMCVRKKRSWK